MVDQLSRLDIGQGFAVDRGFYAGLSEQNGQLYVLHDTIKALFRVDPANGNRTRVSGAGTAYGRPPPGCR